MQSAKDQNDPLIGSNIAERYEVTAKIGGGGMGSVYSATDTVMNRKVALKVLRPQLAVESDANFLKRFQREAETTCRVEHPNAISVFDYGVDGENPYLVMQYVEGRSLSKLLKEEGALAPKRVKKLCEQICGALAVAHKVHIVHRDLKPDNIMVVEDAEGGEWATVLDFGIAKIVGPDCDQFTVLTQTGGILGTPQYMSPEQVRGKLLDGRSDIYSLGIIIYEMLSGYIPYDADSVGDLLLCHMTKPPIPFVERGTDHISPAVEQVIFKALSKEREDRQQSVEELVYEFDSALLRGDLNSTSHAAAKIPPGKAFNDSNDSTSTLGLWFKALIALVVLVAAALFFFQPGQEGGERAPREAPNELIDELRLKSESAGSESAKLDETGSDKTKSDKKGVQSSAPDGKNESEKATGEKEAKVEESAKPSSSSEPLDIKPLMNNFSGEASSVRNELQPNVVLTLPDNQIRQILPPPPAPAPQPQAAAPAQQTQGGTQPQVDTGNTARTTTQATADTRSRQRNANTRRNQGNQRQQVRRTTNRATTANIGRQGSAGQQRGGRGGGVGRAGGTRGENRRRGR